MENALVGQLLEKSHSIAQISSMVNYLWGKHGPIHLFKLENGLLLFDLPSEEVKNWVLQNSPWHINHTPLILRPWQKNFQALELRQSKPPVWIMLKNLPLELMTPEGISYVASAIGIPICLDRATEAVRKA